MKEVLRFFSLGVVNLLGIIFPGLMFILLSFATVIWPTMELLHKFYPSGSENHFPIGWATLNQSYNWNSPIAIVAGFMVSYVIGYILRLTTVDKLDMISAKKVFKQMENDYKKNCPHQEDHDTQHAAIQEDCWPFRGGPADKFPYLHLKSYLEKRGLANLAELVTWSDDPKPKDSNGFQRSKKVINNYKIEVFNKSPQLSSIIESNEAHIRLTFGTWRVSKMFLWISLSVIATLLIISALSPHLLLHQLSLLIFIELLIALLLFFAKKMIENLFHYQRIKELVQILVCTKLAREDNLKSKTPT